MHNLKAKYIVITLLFGIVFTACNEDFNTLDSSIDIGVNFETSFDTYAVKAYTKKLEPVQTNNLPIDQLGVYKDGFGTTTASVVSQVSPSSFSPTFPNNTAFDSIVLNIPYFSTNQETDDDGNSTFKLDSIFGSTPIKISIYRSNYFLRDFELNADFDDRLEYFSNGTTSEDNPVNVSDLENVLLYEDMSFEPDARQVKFFNEDGDVTQRANPAFRVKLYNDDVDPSDDDYDEDITIAQDIAYWESVILDKEGEPELSNSNNFNNYFRGIYIKAEATAEDGTLMLLSIGATSTINFYYSRDDGDTDGDGIPNFADADIDNDGVLDNGEDEDGDGINDESDPDQTNGIDEDNNGIDDEVENESSSFSLTFSGTSVDFLDTQFTTPISDGNEDEGDSTLFLKGGDGSIGVIELFDDNFEDNSLQDFIDTYRGDDIENPKRLINEAFLNFYVDQTMINGEEPDRIYIYDIKNETPLIDYFVDQSFANTPIESKRVHLPPLERMDEEPDGEGIRYRARITEHLNNILLRDSSNVKLGLAISKSVSLESDVTVRFAVDSEDEDFDYIPLSAILSPRGTVLYGSTQDVPEDKRIELEIYYTEPDFN